ncbi:prefoldin subunit beta [archaeon]|nr:prefoldin subunit beta [archaeon]
MELSKQAQDLLGQMQGQQQQMQIVAMQKQQLDLQERELDAALDEVKKSKSDVYKAIGPMMVKSTKSDITKELKEQKDDIDMKKKMLVKQEKKIEEMLETGKSKIKSLMPGQAK